MFIDTAYFVGEIVIPNIKDNTTTLTQAIVQYEKEILINLLGYKLYSLLIADLDDGIPQTQIYKDLVDGAEFTHNYRGTDYLLKWEGLKNTAKQSLIAYYVYYQHVQREITQLSGVGVLSMPSGKGNRVSSVNKLINAWERMRELYGIMPPEYRKCYSGRVPFITMGNFPCATFNCDPSAYNFLLANKSDYPDWVFTPQWNINAFGI